MPYLSKLGARRTVSVTYDGETIEVTFKPAVVNADWQERIQGLEKNDQTGYLKLLAEVLVAWDVLDDEGQPLPPTAELMRQFPTDLLYEVAWTIFESLAPNGRAAGTLPLASDGRAHGRAAGVVSRHPGGALSRRGALGIS